MTPHEALQTACDAAGGQKALGRLIGVNQQTVHSWLRVARRGCAPEYVLAIEKATGVSRHELRPDVFPKEDAAA